MPTKDLILSLATNLDFDDYARFNRSARRFCPTETTDIVLFAEPTEPRYVELADRLQIKLIPIANFSRLIHKTFVLKVVYRLWLLLLKLGTALKLEGFAQIQRDVVAAWIHPICSRHFLAHDYLATNPNYRSVLLTDSRDVVFQDNPFNLINPHVLNVFMQDPSLTFGKENLDTKWFRDVFGAELLKQIIGKPTLCCGTTIASSAIILKYLALMECEILRHAAYVVDQAVHNKLVHLDLPKELVELHNNASGIVLTLGETSEEAYDIINQQVRVNGEVVPVVHQYDRIPSLKVMIEEMYDSSFALSNF